MSFLAPLWLIGLLPWGGIVYLLLRRRRRPTGVPFIPLWRGPYHPPKPTRRFARPPFAVTMVMLAMLLALLAAARPAVRDPTGSRSAPIPVVVDRGAGMSARDGARLGEAFGELQRGLIESRALRRLELHPVPAAGVKRMDFSDLTNPFPFLLTAADTRAAVTSTASRLLAETTGPVIVISDQTLAVADDRVIQVPPPDAPVRNVGIVNLAARASPKPQVMVTVAGSGWEQAVRVVVSSDGVETIGMLDALSEGQERTAFIDVPRLGQTVEARLELSDGAAADNRAWLARQGAWARVEVRAPVSPAVQRLLESYTATRPPTDGSARVLIVGEPADAGAERAVVVPARRDGRSTAGTFAKSPHAVTAAVEFSGIAEATVATDPPPGWTPALRRGDEVWVAVRETPARQAWVGFDAPDWTRKPAFVVFWAGLLDWVGGSGDDTFASERVGALGEGWKPAGPTPEHVDATQWPGLFTRADGSVRAVNSGLIATGKAAAGGWRDRFAALHVGGQIELSSYLLLAALVSVLLAAAAWKSPSLTEISGKTTVASDGVLTEVRAERAGAATSRPS
jgi:hypothetical protein